MFLQGGAQSEARLALFTPVGLLPGVSPHVVLQAQFPFEALCALVTPVRLLVGVGTRVYLQVAFRSEALCALVIPMHQLVRILVGVGTHVDDHLVNLATQDMGPALAAAPTPNQLLMADEPLVG